MAYIINGLYDSCEIGSAGGTTTTSVASYFPLQTPDANNPIEGTQTGSSNDTSWNDTRMWDDDKVWYDEWYI